MLILTEEIQELFIFQFCRFSVFVCLMFADWRLRAWHQLLDRLKERKHFLTSTCLKNNISHLKMLRDYKSFKIKELDVLCKNYLTFFPCEEIICNLDYIIRLKMYILVIRLYLKYSI